MKRNYCAPKTPDWTEGEVPSERDSPEGQTGALTSNDTKKKMLPAGFEPASKARKAPMIGHYTTGACDNVTEWNVKHTDI